MKKSPHIWLLLPHALSPMLFGGAILWMSVTGSNRTLPDLYLAIGGLAALGVAVLTSIAGWVIVFRQGALEQWPWLLAYPLALLAGVSAGMAWFGAHLA